MVREKIQKERRDDLLHTVRVMVMIRWAVVPEL
jgi:hypothetical protein